jgi:hypothetical protein
LFAVFRLRWKRWVGGRASIRATARWSRGPVAACVLRIDAFNCSIASGIGGTTEAVTLLPPEAGPSGGLNRRSDLDLMRLQPEFRATVLAITVRVPVPMSCVAAGDQASALDNHFDLRAGLPE